MYASGMYCLCLGYVCIGAYSLAGWPGSWAMDYGTPGSWAMDCLCLGLPSKHVAKDCGSWAADCLRLPINANPIEG